VNHAAVSYVERGDGRILCVWNSRYGGWTLPGGKVEEGETIQAAQARELFEETCLRTLRALPLYTGETCVNNAPEDRGRLVHVFRVKPESYRAFQGEPGRPVVWFTRQEFLRGSPFAEFYVEMFESLESDEEPEAKVSVVAHACDLDLDDIDTDRAIRALEQQWNEP
jgi:ADP-ribose pyrophosphatase YjhB (NUDIX family)